MRVLLKSARGRSARRRDEEEGAIAVLTAMLAVVLLVASAFVVDLGSAYVAGSKAQTAADASALAGLQALHPGDSTQPDFASAVTAVKAFAAENYAVPDDAWTGCTDPAPLPTHAEGCISFLVSGGTAKARVVMPDRTVDTAFAGLVGVDSLEVSASARAMMRTGGPSDCALCVIGDGAHDFQNGDVTVSGADIHLNGDVSVGPNGLVATDGAITVEGIASGSDARYDPDPTESAGRMEDPLVDYPAAPDISPTVKTDPCGEGASHGPGTYGSVSIRGANCTLQPGLYVIVGTWDLAGNDASVLTGDGVTLHFTCGTTTVVRSCAPGEAGGTLDNSGNGSVAITAPTTGPYAGMALWFDRANGAVIRLTGNGQAGLSGTIYALSAQLLINGNGCAGTLNALVIVRDLAFNGSPACLRSAYAPSSNVQVPPSQMRLDE